MLKIFNFKILSKKVDEEEGNVYFLNSKQVINRINNIMTSNRNWRQDKLLTPYEIAKLKQSGVDIHDLKGGKNASKKDLYKD
ncbi:hypothetical protein CY0110_06664, partial [Crocosphaera chwakensis CCY0110]